MKLKKVKFFTESVKGGIDESQLDGLGEIGLTWKIDGESITFHVDVDEKQGLKKIVRAGDDLYWIDGIEGYCVHYALTDSGSFQSGVITELWSQAEWLLFE